MDGTVFAVLVVVGFGLSYVVSLWRNPQTNCSRCNGNPGRTGWFYWWSKGACGRCGGSGKKVRLGRRIWDSRRSRR